MKKAYRKPSIVFENFELSKSIASCGQGVKMNFLDPHTCSAELDAYAGIELNIFLNDKICHYWNENLCYHAPNDNEVLFNS